MGEVYRARDTRLDRTVALKILPTALADDPQFKERFDREARAISQLDHPNICALYDVGAEARTSFLVMQYLEGETLADRIARGALPVADAMTIAMQIADALDSAHRAGIVHRDLKPANVMLTKSGAKLLDFGLAKSGAAVATVTGATMMPTAARLTEQGTILGTVQYMSPEQIEGRDADARSDIFAFGLLLYEMRTGTRAFPGATPASVIAAILERPAPSLEPAALDRLVQTCLAKNPDDRFQTVRDLKRALEWSLTPSAAPAVPGSRSKLWPAVAGMAALATVVAGFGLYRARALPPARTAPPVTLSFVPPAATGIAPVWSVTSGFSMAPDGSALIYHDASGHYRLQRFDLISLPPLHVEDGTSASWSPDSRFVLFDATADMMTMRVPDGAPESIAKKSGASQGVTWSDSGQILYTIVKSESSLMTVAASGGMPVPVELPGVGPGNYFMPEFVAQTDDFVVGFEPKGGTEMGVYLATLKGGRAINPVRLMKNETAAGVTPAGGGRLLFVRNDTLYSQRLDLKARALAGDPEVLVTGVASIPGFRMAEFSASRTGDIAWRAGGVAVAQVAIFDRTGLVTGTAGGPGPILAVKLAPDEQHLLITTHTSQWLVEPNQTGSLTIGQDRSGMTTLWSADGSHFLVPSPSQVLERAVSAVSAGHDNVREVARVPGLERLEDVSFDGRTVLFTQGALATAVYAVRLDANMPEPTPTPVLQTGEFVFNTRFSPDARWIVYEAVGNLEQNGSGIYVQPFPGPGVRRQISRGGKFPVWRKDGKEIVFWNSDRLWSIRVDSAGSDLHFGDPVPLFSAKRPPSVVDITPMAVSRDGSKIYLLQPVEQPDSNVIHVKLNALEAPR
jgi:hypothetical protein